MERSSTPRLDPSTPASTPALRINRHRPTDPDPSLTPVRRRPSLDFSLTGLVYCAMMMFMGLVALARYQISPSFPFGVIKRAVERRQADTMIVFPAVARVDPKLLANCVPAEKTGPTMRPKRGGVDEFYGLKEHRRGENPRFI